MANSRPGLILTGALVKIYINNKLYKEAQAVNWTLDYGEQAVFGIDSPFPQEIGPTRATVSGSIQGLRLKYSGGLQAYSGRTLIKDIQSAPYISIRIQDRQTSEDLLFIPAAKISNQQYSVNAKGVMKLNFNFQGMLGLEPLDR